MKGVSHEPHFSRQELKEILYVSAAKTLLNKVPKIQVYNEEGNYEKFLNAGKNLFKGFILEMFKKYKYGTFDIEDPEVTPEDLMKFLILFEKYNLLPFKKERFYEYHEVNNKILNSTESMEEKAWRLENFGIFLIKNIERILFTTKNKLF